MIVTSVKATWPEKRGFSLFRSENIPEYVFIHFLTPAQIQIDGNWRNVEKGDWILHGAFTKRGLKSPDGDLLHDWVHLLGDVEEMLARYGLQTDRIYSPTDNSFITPLVQELQLEFESSSPFREDACRMLAEELFLKLGRAERMPAPKESPYLYPKFAALRSDILLHYDAPPSVPEMAAALSLSPSRFHRLYKSYFGVSPAKDLQDTRVEHAKLLLTQRGVSVTAVAEQTGYASVYHFIRQFKARVGMTPGEYKKR